MLCVNFVVCMCVYIQALDKLGYNPYMNPIVPSETYTTSSSDEENYRKNNRRKKSANTGGDNTPRHRGEGERGGGGVATHIQYGHNIS